MADQPTQSAAPEPDDGKDPAPAEETEEQLKARMLKMLDSHLCMLIKHFDSVEIVATSLTLNGTRCIQRGIGNWYARVGACRDFVLEADECSRRQAWERNNSPE